MTILSPTRYRSITSDYDSYDGDVVEAIGYAQKFFEQKTERYFDYRNAAGLPIIRVEKLKVYPDRVAYPKATPVRSVLVPVGAALTGVGVGALSPSTVLSAGCWPYREVSVTYTGGFEEAEMPEDIVLAVAEIAAFYLPSEIQIKSMIPVGATTVHVGDVSFSGKNLRSSVSLSLPAFVWDTIRLWKRRLI